MIRAAAYVRVSTSKQADEGLSLEAQEKRVRGYIEGEGWELTDVYVERGVSGRRSARPELDRLLGSLGGIDRLVIPKLDRLGRSTIHLHKLFETLQDADVELVSVDDKLDTSTAGGKFMRDMRVALAEFESATIGERVRSVTAARMEQGKHHGRPPYGYQSRQGILYIVEPAASIVRRIFEDYAAGVSQRSLGRALNDEKVPSQTGKGWTQGTVSKILGNATYTGRNVLNGEEHEGAHDPLISPDLWDRVVKLRAATARTTGKGRGRPSSGSHLFTRTLRLTCAHCGSTMAPRVDRDRRAGKAYERYYCLGRSNHGTESCPMTPVPREPIDSAVFAYFEKAGLNMEAMREELREAADSKAREVGALLAQARRDAAHAAEAIQRVRRDYTSGVLEAAEWRELSAGLKDDAEAAQAKVTQLEARATEVASARGAADDADGEAVRRLAEVRAAVAGQVQGNADLDAARAALSRMFEGFTIGRPTVGNPADLSEVERILYERQEAETDRSLAEEGVQSFEVGHWTVLPVPRAEVVAGVDETWTPILRREPLTVAANNDAVGLHT